MVCHSGTVNIRVGNGTDEARITAVADGRHAVKVGSQVGWVSKERRNHSRIMKQASNLVLWRRIAGFFCMKKIFWATPYKRRQVVIEHQCMV